MSITNEVQYPQPATSGFLTASVAGDGTVTYSWSSGGSKTDVPTIATAGGSFIKSQTITINPPSSNTQAVIHYTLDGTYPTAASTVYTAPFIINDSCTLSAVAIVSGSAPSDVVSQTYTITRRICVPSYGMYFSDDNGVTWTQYVDSTGNNTMTVSYMSSQTCNRSTIVTGGQQGIGVSRDRGNTFSVIPTYYGVTGSSVSATTWITGTLSAYPHLSMYPFVMNDEFWILVGSGANTTSAPPGMILGRSLDGLHWKFMNVGQDSSGQAMFFASFLSSSKLWNTLPVRPDWMAYSNGIYIILMCNEYIISSDNGNTWTNVTTTPWINQAPYAAIRATAIGFIVVSNSAVYYSTDGMTWTAATFSIPAYISSSVNFYEVSEAQTQLPFSIFTHKKSNLIIISVVGSPYGAYYSTDCGKTFNFLESWPGIEQCQVAFLKSASSDAGFALALYNNENVGYMSAIVGSLKTAPAVNAVCPSYLSSITGATHPYGCMLWTGSSYVELPKYDGTYRSSVGTNDPTSWKTQNNSNLQVNYTYGSFVIDDRDPYPVQAAQTTVAPIITGVKTAVNHLAITHNTDVTLSGASLTSAPIDSCYCPTNGYVYFTDGYYIYYVNPAATTPTKVKLTTTILYWSAICWDATDGCLLGCIAGTGIYKITTAGDATKIYTGTGYYTGIVYNTLDSLIYVYAQSGAISSLTIAGASFTTVVTPANTLVGIKNGASGKIILTDYYNSDGAISILDTATKTVTSVGTPTSFSNIPYSLFNSTYVGISVQYITGFTGRLLQVAADVTTTAYTSKTDIDSSYTYMTICSTGTVVYALYGTSSTVVLRTITALSSVSDSIYTVTVNGDANTGLFPWVFYTLDGTDPTITQQTPLTGDAFVMNVQNATNTLQGPITSLYTMQEQPIGVTIKAVAILPSYNCSAVASYTTA